MINTKDLELAVALTLASAYVEGETPQSLMIVSDRPEAGKTLLVSQFSQVDGIAVISDATAKGLLESFRADMIKGQLKHLIIPEFLAPISRNQSTVNSFLSTLQILIEDGFQRIDTGFMHQKYDNPKRIGVIACLPKPAFLQNRVRWGASGLLSRFLLVSYAYSMDTIDAILASIMERQYLKETKFDLNFTGDVKVELPSAVAKKCRDLALATTEKARHGRGIYGFRQLESVQRLVLAKAVLDKAQGIERGCEATHQDFDAVASISYLFNDEFNEVRE